MCEVTASLRVSSATPQLPRARGPLSEWLFDAIVGVSAPVHVPAVPRDADPLVDDDVQLSLYCCYELMYRGFRDARKSAESDLRIGRFRQMLEVAFERALRDEARPAPADDVASAVDQMLADFCGPSLSRYMHDFGTTERFREFMVHRSAYQLKEADPHSLAIPRLPSGRRKSALIEIQMDEYGAGRPGASHAELFADAMAEVGLDATYGAYISSLPGVTLATCNLISMLGMQRRTAGAVLGHLAVFEMTSVEPMARYSTVASRLGMPPAVRRFYDVHVDADVHHGSLAREALLGGDLRSDGLDPADVLFGAEALLHVEDRFTNHLLDCWSHDASSLWSGSTVDGRLAAI
jgi:hypothetical protein